MLRWHYDGLDCVCSVYCCTAVHTRSNESEQSFIVNAHSVRSAVHLDCHASSRHACISPAGDYERRSLAVVKRRGAFVHVMNQGWNKKHGNLVGMMYEVGAVVPRGARVLEPNHPAPTSIRRCKAAMTHRVSPFPCTRVKLVTRVYACATCTSSASCQMTDA